MDDAYRSVCIDNTSIQTRYYTIGRRYTFIAMEQEDQNSAVAERERRERAENALALARESFDLIFEDAPVMMHSIDEDGKLLRVNRRWVETLGYHEDEVLGHQSIDFLTDESRLRAVEDTLPLFRMAGAARSVGYQFVKKDGEPLDILLDADIVYTPAGSPLALAALRDRVDTAQWRQASATTEPLRRSPTFSWSWKPLLYLKAAFPLRSPSLIRFQGLT